VSDAVIARALAIGVPDVAACALVDAANEAAVPTTSASSSRRPPTLPSPSPLLRPRRRPQL
jgi:hypothetical protein